MDEADGLDWPTLCRCDVIFAAKRETLQNKRGVVTQARQPELVRTIIAAHGWAQAL